MVSVLDGDIDEIGLVNKERNFVLEVDVFLFFLFCVGCNGIIKECDGEVEGCDGDVFILVGCSCMFFIFFSLLVKFMFLLSMLFLCLSFDKLSKVCWCFVRVKFEDVFVVFFILVVFVIFVLVVVWREIVLWRVFKVRVKNIVRIVCDVCIIMIVFKVDIS